MKKISVIIALLLVPAMSVRPQIAVPEPEFLNSYCILTSDSTYDVLPRETGIVGVHESKAKRTFRTIGQVANLAGAVVGLGTVIGSFSGGDVENVANGMKMTTAAFGVSSVAGAASALAGADGMDIVFSGPSSAYVFDPAGGDARILIRTGNNDEDPMALYRIVRLKSNRNSRRIKWMELEPDRLGLEGPTNRYLSFSGHKFGYRSYILTIPAAELVRGEYAVFYLNMGSATTVPVGTFSIR